MSNKKKWTSILTIATSLILCIISTFGITLAFFGGNASANLSTITLKTGIEIGAAIESSVGSAKVVPGQPVKIEATGTIEVTDKGTPTAANAVDGVVRAKLTVGDELGDVEISGESDYWTAGGDGYYYLVTAQGGTTLRVVKVGDSVKLFGNLVVNKNFTNADSGKSVEASVIFEVVQADIYKSDGTKETLTVTNATTNTSPLYSAFDAVAPFDGYNMTISLVTNGYDNKHNVKCYPITVIIDDNEPIYLGTAETIETVTSISAKGTHFVLSFGESPLTGEDCENDGEPYTYSFYNETLLGSGGFSNWPTSIYLNNEYILTEDVDLYIYVVKTRLPGVEV